MKVGEVWYFVRTYSTPDDVTIEKVGTRWAVFTHHDMKYKVDLRDPDLRAYWGKYSYGRLFYSQKDYASWAKEELQREASLQREKARMKALQPEYIRPILQVTRKHGKVACIGKVTPDAEETNCSLLHTTENQYGTVYQCVWPVGRLVCANVATPHKDCPFLAAVERGEIPKTKPLPYVESEAQKDMYNTLKKIRGN